MYSETRWNTTLKDYKSPFASLIYHYINETSMPRKTNTMVYSKVETIA